MERVGKLLEEEEEFIEEIIREIKRGKDPALIFLNSFKRHMNIAASWIDCPYCAKHMRLEAEEIAKVAGWIETYGNKKHVHSFIERLKITPSIIKILLYTVMGGLKRAGIL